VPVIASKLFGWRHYPCDYHSLMLTIVLEFCGLIWQMAERTSNVGCSFIPVASDGSYRVEKPFIRMKNAGPISVARIPPGHRTSSHEQTRCGSTKRVLRKTCSTQLPRILGLSTQTRTDRILRLWRSSGRGHAPARLPN
jgi:hypothetical protein